VKAPTVTLRSGTPRDGPFVAQLSGHVFGELGRYDRILPAWLLEPGVQTVIAEIGMRPAGFGMLGFRRTFGGFGVLAGELLAIAVAPEHQQHGVGRKLLHAIEQLARRRTRIMVLNTAESNATAQRFFAANGFAPLGTRDRFYPAGQRAIEMRKTIVRTR
jgi:ribosomal protein S18 acetylase RimI-like enzyme